MTYSWKKIMIQDRSSIIFSRYGINFSTDENVNTVVADKFHKMTRSMSLASVS